MGIGLAFAVDGYATLYQLSVYNTHNSIAKQLFKLGTFFLTILLPSIVSCVTFFSYLSLHDGTKPNAQWYLKEHGVGELVETDLSSSQSVHEMEGESAENLYGKSMVHIHVHLFGEERSGLSI